MWARHTNKSCALTLSRKSQGKVLHVVRKAGLTDRKREGMGEADQQQVFPEVAEFAKGHPGAQGLP